MRGNIHPQICHINCFQRPKTHIRVLPFVGSLLLRIILKGLIDDGVFSRLRLPVVPGVTFGVGSGSVIIFGWSESGAGAGRTGAGGTDAGVGVGMIFGGGGVDSGARRTGAGIIMFGWEGSDVFVGDGGSDTGVVGAGAGGAGAGVGIIFV